MATHAASVEEDHPTPREVLARPRCCGRRQDAAPELLAFSRTWSRALPASGAACEGRTSSWEPLLHFGGYPALLQSQASGLHRPLSSALFSCYRPSATTPDESFSFRGETVQLPGFPDLQARLFHLCFPEPSDACTWRFSVEDRLRHLIPQASMTASPACLSPMQAS